MRSILVVFLLIFSAGVKAEGVYGGLELQARNMGVNSSSIGKFTNTNLQPNVFAGVNLNENFGLEAGANICRFKHTGKNFHKSNALHVGAMGYLPLSDKVKLVGGIGAARIVATYHNPQTNLKVRKAVPRGLIGLNYSILDSVDVRASLIHEKTKKLKNSFVQSKDSTSYSLGVIKNF